MLLRSALSSSFSPYYVPLCVCVFLASVLVGVTRRAHAASNREELRHTSSSLSAWRGRRGGDKRMPAATTARRGLKNRAARRALFVSELVAPCLVMRRLDVRFISLSRWRGIICTARLCDDGSCRGLVVPGMALATRRLLDHRWHMSECDAACFMCFAECDGENAARAARLADSKTLVKRILVKVAALNLLQ